MPPVTRIPLPAADFPADPYPGRMPGWSFVAAGRPGSVWPLHADAATPSGWRLDGDGRELDDWLTARGESPLAQRIPVLSYGSNRCPGKIDWLRSELGLTGSVVAIRVLVRDLAAVWAAGVRRRDDQRPATLAAIPGAVEEHMVWLATPDQLAVLDVCESRDVRYRLVRLHSGRVELPDGAVFPELWTYVGTVHRPSADVVDSRLPLLVQGTSVRCAAVSQADARSLAGSPADTDGLTVSDVRGAPSALDWPAELFVYGSLRPGDPAWPLLAPHAATPPRPADVSGTVHDTPEGYPGLTLSPATGPDSVHAPGWLVRLQDPAAALPELDRYEGSEYARARVRTLDGTLCWTYLWSPSVPADGNSTAV